MSRIYYGVDGSYLEITQKCLELAVNQDYIEIPSSDVERATLYGGDPAELTVKHILVISKTGVQHKYDIGMILRTTKDSITTEPRQKVRVSTSIEDHAARLADVQAKLILTHGSFYEEGVEQLMSIMFIQPQDRVLELGSNIGRNSLVISTILNDDSKLVTLETDVNIVRKLLVNKAANNMQFQVENAALTKQQLIQPFHSWQSFPSEVLLPDHFRINSISLDELKKKYGLEFNVLVADCEGALYYILREFPDLLQGSLKTLIVENDYTAIEHKKFVDECFTKNNFLRVWSHGGGWGPCADFFWEVWQK